MTTDKLIDSLAASGLISDELVADLRQRMLESWEGFNPADVIRWLVVEGHITAAQGDRLLRDAKGGQPSVAATRDAIANPYEDLEVLPDDEEDDVLPPLPEESMPGVDVGEGLDLLPLDDAAQMRTPRKPPAARPALGGSPPAAGSPSGAAPGPSAGSSRTSRSWRSEVRPAPAAGQPAPAARGGAPGQAKTCR